MLRLAFLEKMGKGLVGYTIGNSVAKMALASALEKKVSNILTGEPVSNAKVKIYQPLQVQPSDVSQIDKDTLIEEFETDSNGVYGTGTVPVEFDRWGMVKLLYSDRPNAKAVRKGILARRIAKPTADGKLSVVIEHPDFYPAIKSVNTKGGSELKIIPRDFDIDRFNRIARPDQRTRRWMTQPYWVIETKNSTEGQREFMKELIRERAPGITNGFVNGSQIGEEYSMRVFDGGLIIYFDDTDEFSGSTRTNEDNSIKYGGMGIGKKNIDNKREFMRYFAKPLGLKLGDDEVDGDGNYSNFARNAGEILYTLPPGSRSPDIDPV